MPRVRSLLLLADLVAIVAVLAPLKSASADAAPPPVPSLGGPAPFDYQETNVQMAFERVEMTVAPDERSQDAPFRIDVSAWFLMRNLGSVPEQMDVAFPLESLNQCESGDVWLEDASYSTATVDIATFSASADGVPLAVSEKATPFPADLLCESPDMSWATFPVTFPVGQDVLLSVSYSMLVSEPDSIQTIEYSLQTGSGWRGPISKGYIIFRLPYLVERNNILAKTTPGYQALWNEIYWSIEELEPSPRDDIRISFVSPSTWIDLQEWRHRVESDPGDSEAWRLLAETLNRIATYKGVYRAPEHRNRIYDAYQAGLAANPEDLSLLRSYADFLLEKCCYYIIDDPSQLRDVVAVYDRILALDPQDEAAWSNIEFFQRSVPGFKYTPPATRTSTSTQPASATLSPSGTSTRTLIPRTPTSTIARAATATRAPSATTPATPQPVQSSSSPRTALATAIVISLALILGGAAVAHRLTSRHNRDA